MGEHKRRVYNKYDPGDRVLFDNKTELVIIEQDSLDKKCHWAQQINDKMRKDYPRVAYYTGRMTFLRHGDVNDFEPELTLAESIELAVIKMRSL